MELLLKIETQRQAELAKMLMDQWLTPSDVVAAPPTVQKALSHAPEAKSARTAAAAPTPLEVAIAEKNAEKALDAAAAEPVADPFTQLQSGTEPAAATEVAEEPKAEKKPRKNAKKSEPAAEPEKPEDKELTLDDIRKASTTALELVGATTIQEALAKFNATDEKNVLRMSALREPDYKLYVDYLKKKVNDAAKEWPNA